MSYNLFLDDIRNPVEVCTYIKPVSLQAFFKDYEWVICRNYSEFTNYIIKNGIPNVISFDHDLADEHYTPEEYWTGYESSRNYQEDKYPHYTEKTGYDCAKWLIEYCMKNNTDIPKSILCHSMNPVGKDKILNAFQQVS